MSKTLQIKKLYQFLFELAIGNLNFSVAYTDCERTNEIIDLLNTIAIKMKEVIVEQDHLLPHYKYQNLVQHSIVLDSDYNLKYFDENVKITFSYSPSELIKLNITDILTSSSVVLWHKIKSDIDIDQKYHETFPLVFCTKDKLVVPLFCTITRHYYTNDILINSITTILQDLMEDSNFSLSNSSKNSEAQIIRNVYEFILNNLEEPLPSTKELSKYFGINEFNLKNRFKISFNTSIYQFYNDERLKKAHNLISKTDTPLKEIAFLSGFNDYVTFSKAFKKKYQYPPSSLKRLV